MPALAAQVPYPNVGLRDVRFGGAAGFRARIFYPTDATAGAPAPYLSDGKATSAGATPPQSTLVDMQYEYVRCCTTGLGRGQRMCSLAHDFPHCWEAMACGWQRVPDDKSPPSSRRVYWTLNSPLPPLLSPPTVLICTRVVL